MFPDVQELLLSVMLEVEVKKSHFNLIIAFFNVFFQTCLYITIF